MTTLSPLPPIKSSLEAAHAAVLEAMRTRKKDAPSVYGELTRRIKEAGLLERTQSFYIRRLIAFISLIAATWVFVSIMDSWWAVLPGAFILGALTTQLAFVGHEAAHRQVFASNRLNSLSALFLANLGAGMSIGWWTSKHTRHHAAPNQDGKDPDIAMRVLSFTPKQTLKRSKIGRILARHQGWFFFPLLTFAAFSFITASYKALFDSTRKVKRRGLDVSLLTLRLLALPALAFLLLPPLQAVSLVLIQTVVLGVYMGLTFAPNHKGMPVVPAGVKLDYLRRQVLTSRNIVGTRFMDEFMGGLNYQIEHHLFPSMPRPHLKKAARIVKEYCLELSIPYCETKLLESYRIVANYLSEVGLSHADPLECPMISELRRLA